MTKLYIDIQAEPFSKMEKIEGYNDCIKGLTDEIKPRYIYCYDLIMTNLLHNKGLEGKKAKSYYSKHILPEIRTKRCRVLIQTTDRFTSQPPK
jgi:hypothetical protein